MKVGRKDLSRQTIDTKADVRSTMKSYIIGAIRFSS